jgi:hypothetical protein
MLHVNESGLSVILIRNQFDTAKPISEGLIAASLLSVDSSWVRIFPLLLLHLLLPPLAHHTPSIVTYRHHAEETPYGSRMWAKARIRKDGQLFPCISHSISSS